MGESHITEKETEPQILNMTLRLPSSLEQKSSLKTVTFCFEIQF